MLKSYKLKIWSIISIRHMTTFLQAKNSTLSFRASLYFWDKNNKKDIIELTWSLHDMLSLCLDRSPEDTTHYQKKIQLHISEDRISQLLKHDINISLTVDYIKVISNGFKARLSKEAVFFFLFSEQAFNQALALSKIWAIHTGRYILMLQNKISCTHNHIDCPVLNLFLNTYKHGGCMDVQLICVVCMSMHIYVWRTKLNVLSNDNREGIPSTLEAKRVFAWLNLSICPCHP